MDGRRLNEAEVLGALKPLIQFFLCEHKRCGATVGAVM